VWPQKSERERENRGGGMVSFLPDVVGKEWRGGGGPAWRLLVRRREWGRGSGVALGHSTDSSTSAAGTTALAAHDTRRCP
jgi:hypothetical protein